MLVQSMGIDAASEIVDPELGPIRFNDGEGMTTLPGSGGSEPGWVCRPDGWVSDFEILIPGNSSCGPTNLDIAKEALRQRTNIEELARFMSSEGVHLAWVDLKNDPHLAFFTDEEDIYLLWTGTLDSEWKIIDMSKGAW